MTEQNELTRGGPASGSVKSIRHSRRTSKERLNVRSGLPSGVSSGAKVRKSKSGGMTKSAKTFKKENQVHGNRHLTACGNHFDSNVNTKKP